MRILGILLIFVLFSTFACKQASEGSNVVMPSKSTINTDDAGILDLLQGRWRNVNDPKNTMVIEDNAKKEEYEGMEVTNVSYFELDDRCINTEIPGLEPEKDRYIIMEGVCLYIKELDGQKLVISNPIGGNFLVYEKVQ